LPADVEGARVEEVRINGSDAMSPNSRDLGRTARAMVEHARIAAKVRRTDGQL
jgi:hypothetical protein